MFCDTVAFTTREKCEVSDRPLRVTLTLLASIPQSKIFADLHSGMESEFRAPMAPRKRSRRSLPKPCVAPEEPVRTERTTIPATPIARRRSYSGLRAIAEYSIAYNRRTGSA